MVVASSTEAEFVATTSAYQVIIWLREVLHELSFTQVEPTQLNMDNHGASDCRENPRSHRKRRHEDA